MAIATITAGTANGGLDRTITLFFQAEKVMMDATIEDYCRYMYTTKGLFPVFDTQDPPQLIPYDGLTALQKLNIYKQAIVYVTKHGAVTKYTNEQIALSQDDIAAMADTKYNMED